MNRKIYFNDKYILLGDQALQTPKDQEFKVVDRIEAEQELKMIVDEFTDEQTKTCIIIRNQNFTKIFDELKKYFHYIEAGGGFIEKGGHFLCIHRNGRWDLPKGKLEKNEKPEDGAVRECEEECAVRNLKIVRQLNSTFHIYPHKKGFALKQTFWYYMTTDYNKSLRPQKEENIDQVIWSSKDELLSKILPDTYYTIADVIREGLDTRGL